MSNEIYKTKQFWEEVKKEFTALSSETGIYSCYLCYSESFRMFWDNNTEFVDYVRLHAAKFLENNNLFQVSAFVLFVPRLKPVTNQQRFEIRVSFLNHMIKTLK